MEYKKILTVILLVIIFLGLRMFRIEERMNFSMDQGEFMIKAYEIWQNKKIVLIGPTASPVVDGRQFFQGPITYYWLTTLGVLGNWDPTKITWLITLMSLGSMWFIYKTAEEMFDKKIAWAAVIMWTVLPKAIDFAGLIWNPSLLLILVPPLMYVAVLAIKNNKWWQFFGWGIILGWALQCHFQAGLIVIATITILIIQKVNLKYWVVGFGGFLIGYAPLLVFDLRNNFYNLRTIGEWLSKGGGGGFELQQFYFLEFLPILIILLAKYFYKWWWWLTLGIVGALLEGMILPTGAKGMPQFWSYADLKMTSEVIIKEDEGQFNVINLLSGDTQFKPLRYLLMIKNKMPMPTDKYEKRLWVVKYNDKLLITNDKLPWELKNAKNMNVTKEWKINEKVGLIKLE